MARLRHAHSADFGAWNNRSGAGLMGLAAISALPLASNRPIWWLIWTVIIAASALLYQGLAWQRPARIRPMAWFFVVAALVPAMAVLQSLELQGLAPFAGRFGQTVSVVPEASQLGALRVLGYLIFFALVIEVSTRRERVIWMTRILFYGITLQAIWALAALNLLGDVAVLWEKTAYLGMATGTFVNRNALACFLGFGLILGSALLSQSTARWPLTNMYGGPVMAAMLIQALALVATQSRLGLLAALAGLIATVLLRAGLLRWAMLLLALAFMAILALLWGQGVFERMLFAQADAAVRLELYRQILAMIQARPLTGFGFDGFAPAFEAFRGPPLTAAVSYGHAHNSYLGLWAELGLMVGSVPPLLGLAAGAICLRRLRRKDGYESNAAAALGVLVLAAVQSSADFGLEIPANAYVFLAILGMGVSQRHPRRDQLSDFGQRNIP
jgi:O-antigen ligase